MNEDKLLGLPRNTAYSLIVFICMACVSTATYILFQTISKPYWLDGEDAPVAGERCHTVVVVNPGPWGSRKPTIEFLKPLKVQFVDWSPGVTWDENVMPNHIAVSAQGGIPAGGMFFITYKYLTATNAEPLPKIMCDGKQCKYAPAIDIDLMLKFLLSAQGVLIVAFIFILGFYIRAERLLLSEKNSTINKALNLLISTQSSQEDVSESARAVEKMQVPTAAKPKPIKPNGKQSKKT